MMKKYIRYADFKHLLRVPDGEEDGEWTPWLSVREDGVYFNLPEESAMLTKAELMAAFDFLEEVDFARVKQNPKVLTFPCGLDTLEEFIEEYGLSGTINAFDLADWLVGDKSTSERQDDLAIELEPILDQMVREIGTTDIPRDPVMRKLQARSGRPDSCIREVFRDGVIWEGTGGPQRLTKATLSARINRWKRKRNRP